jgi:hypothetical protein
MGGRPPREGGPRRNALGNFFHADVLPRQGEHDPRPRLEFRPISRRLPVVYTGHTIAGILIAITDESLLRGLSQQHQVSLREVDPHPTSRPMSSDPLAQRRIVLWCPYVHWHIAPTIASKVLGQMGSCKYQWFQRFIAKYRDNIFVYCDASHTSMVHYHGDVLSHLVNPDARKEITMAEAKRWNELNQFAIKSENFLNRPSQIQPHDLDAPLASDPLRSDLYQVFSRQDIFKVVHLTHYIFGLGHLAHNLRHLNVQMLCFESNLAKYKFFNRYFPYIREVAVIPFAVQARFRTIKPFPDRLNKCVATGGISLHRLSPGLMEFFFEYSCNNFYPLRVFLHENAAAVADYIHVKMGLYDASMNDALKSSVTRGTSWSELVNRPIAEIMQIDSAKKIAYYSEDIVATYNNFRFSFVSDEVYHAPALGFFEAMACGTIPIGIDDRIYRDLGLVRNVNYLTFDGSFGGLMQTLIQAQNNPASVQEIPANNAGLVKSFSEERVACLFTEKLTREFSRWTSTQGIKVPAKSAPPVRTALAA